MRVRASLRVGCFLAGRCSQTDRSRLWGVRLSFRFRRLFRNDAVSVVEGNGDDRSKGPDGMIFSHISDRRTVTRECLLLWATGHGKRHVATRRVPLSGCGRAGRLLSDNGAGGAFCEAGPGFGAMHSPKHRRADTGDCVNRGIEAEVFRFRIFGSAKTNDTPLRLSRRTTAGEIKAMSHGADPTESLLLNTCRTDDRLWRKVRVFGVRAHSRERKIQAVGCRRVSVNRRLRTSPSRIENRLQRVEDVVDRMGSGVRCPKRFSEVERCGRL